MIFKKTMLVFSSLMMMGVANGDNYYVPIDSEMKFHDATDVIDLKNDLFEIIDAMEEFKIDTGSYPEGRKTDPTHYSFYELVILNLVENVDNNPNWKGPYLSYERHNASHALYYNKAESNLVQVNIVTYEKEWGEDTTWHENNLGNGICHSGMECHYFAEINGLDSYNYLSMIKEVDRQIDGEVNGKNGDLRWYIHKNTQGIPSYSIQLKGSLVPNPHDN